MGNTSQTTTNRNIIDSLQPPQAATPRTQKRTLYQEPVVPAKEKTCPDNKDTTTGKTTTDTATDTTTNMTTDTTTDTTTTTLPEPSVDYRFSDIPADIDKEPMLLLDTTGSMNYGTSMTDTTPRRKTVGESISFLVNELCKYDHQAGKGGLRTITFSGGDATDMGDLTPDNVREKWKQLQFRGGTQIMPGWKTLMQIYQDEYVDRKEAPLLLLLVITDGEAEDVDEFAAALENNKHAYVTLAMLGYGTEHDSALKKYNKIASSNNHVRVIPFGPETDPRKIAGTLLTMIAKLK